jgi:ubiquinone/menaquinone biosynthesis C-methylase UbiE
MKTSITRFSDRVDDYIKYRPNYPKQIIEILTEKIGLKHHLIIADVGSGTGISSEIFITAGNKVFAVEPNKEMREAAELHYLNDSNFISVNGTAEQTNLKEHSVNIIFCGQAFHWFNKGAAKIEFNRILKLQGHIVLAWNVRKEKSGFQKAYELILKTIPEYNLVTHKNISDKEIADFFSPKMMSKQWLPNFQLFNLEGLKGRLRSSSYCPKRGKHYDKLMHEIENLFYKWEKGGSVTLEYQTQVYWC